MEREWGAGDMIPGEDLTPVENELARLRAAREALREELAGASAARTASIVWRIARLNARIASTQALRDHAYWATVARQR